MLTQSSNQIRLEVLLPYEWTHKKQHCIYTAVRFLFATKFHSRVFGNDWKQNMIWIELEKNLKKKSYFCQAEIISSNVFLGLVYFYWSSGYCWHYICNHVSAKGTPAVSNGSRRCLCRYVSFQYLCSSVIQDLYFEEKYYLGLTPCFPNQKIILDTL